MVWASVPRPKPSAKYLSIEPWTKRISSTAALFNIGSVPRCHGALI